jgi:transposase
MFLLRCSWKGLLREQALAVCAQDGIDLRFHHLDTTSFSRTGEDGPEADEHASTIPHGYAKDHRPDLKQAVLARMVSQDGGVPFVSTRWDGQTSETPMFQERAAALIATVQRSPAPPYLMADAQRDQQDKAAHRSTLGFLPRLPQTLKVVSPVMTHALPWDMGPGLDATTRY